MYGIEFTMPKGEKVGELSRALSEGSFTGSNVEIKLTMPGIEGTFEVIGWCVVFRSPHDGDTVTFQLTLERKEK
jgi:hypothetical protein